MTVTPSAGRVDVVEASANSQRARGGAWAPGTATQASPFTFTFRNPPTPIEPPACFLKGEVYGRTSTVLGTAAENVAQRVADARFEVGQQRRLADKDHAELTTIAAEVAGWEARLVEMVSSYKLDAEHRAAAQARAEERRDAAAREAAIRASKAEVERTRDAQLRQLAAREAEHERERAAFFSHVSAHVGGAARSPPPSSRGGGGGYMGSDFGSELVMTPIHPVASALNGALSSWLPQPADGSMSYIVSARSSISPREGGRQGSAEQDDEVATSATPTVLSAVRKRDREGPQHDESIEESFTSEHSA